MIIGLKLNNPSKKASTISSGIMPSLAIVLGSD
jgi:hypothetical protein